mmetsp:Transcript_3322/g.8459  ORF Transcript_3322/g.8459 Transcript_3322/m.8459 type:complete len:291 (-) Transcript_3322:115-987(-)
MAPRESLPDDLERPRHDIGTLDRNGDGKAHVGVSHVVLVSAADGRAGRNVHPAFDYAPAALCAVLLHDGADDHGGLVVVHDGVHDVASRDGNEAIASCLGHGFLNAPKFGDGNLKLLPDPRIRPHPRHHAPRRADAPRRQANAPSLREAFDEHVPSEAASFLSAQDGRHGYPDVLALDGTVHEGGAEGYVTRSHSQALVSPLQQRHSESLLAIPPQQPLRIGQIQPQSHHARHGRERDVPLLEARHDPQLPRHGMLANDAIAPDQRRGIATRMRSRETEARYERPVRQSR